MHSCIFALDICCKHRSEERNYAYLYQLWGKRHKLNSIISTKMKCSFTKSCSSNSTPTFLVSEIKSQYPNSTPWICVSKLQSCLVYSGICPVHDPKWRWYAWPKSLHLKLIFSYYRHSQGGPAENINFNLID